MNWITRTLPTWQGRLTTGLAVIGAIAVGLWPDHPREPDGEKIVAVALTAVAWLFAELSGNARISEHDRNLFRDIQSHFSDGLLNHLREQDFANDVHKSKVQALWDIGNWDGSRYEFLDPTLEKKWNALHRRIRAFNNLQSTSMAASNADFFTVHHLGRPRHPIPDSVRAEIKELNESASALEKAFNEFSSLARRRLDL